jgi:hypothetical protein
MDGYMHIRPDRLNDAIVRCEAVGSPSHAELFRACRDGHLNVTLLARDTLIPARLLRDTTRPLVVLLGDDDEQPSGPNGWRAWRRLKPWARGALIHAAGSDVHTYRVTVAMAVLHRKFLLIETTSRHAPDWACVLDQARIPAMAVLPRGGVHPVMPAKGARQ